MDFSFEVDGNRSVLRLHEEGAELGWLQYREDEKYLVIEHVEVDPAYRGRGLARKLVDRFAEHVRSVEGRVVSECGVARAMMTGDARYADVFVG